MIELNPISTLLLGELLLILALSVALLLWKGLRAGARERAAARGLVGLINDRQAERNGEVRRVLEERYAYSGDELEQATQDLSRSERLLYQQVIDIFVNRDTVALMRIQIAVEALAGCYNGLLVPVAVEGPGAGAPRSDDAELQRLKDDNKRLLEELRLTMDTMGRMLNEYATAYAGGLHGQGGTSAPPETLQSASAPAPESDVGMEQRPAMPDDPGAAEVSPAPLEGSETAEELSGEHDAEATDERFDETQVVERQPAEALPEDGEDADLDALRGGTDLAELSLDGDEEGADRPSPAAAESASDPDQEELGGIWADALEEQRSASP